MLWVKMIILITTAARRAAAWRIRWFIILFLCLLVFKVYLLRNCKFFLWLFYFRNVCFTFNQHCWFLLVCLLLFFGDDFHNLFFLIQIKEVFPVLLWIIIHELSSFDQFWFLYLEERINIIYYFTCNHHKLTHIGVWLGKRHDNQVHKNPEVKEGQVQELLTGHWIEVNDNHYEDNNINKKFNHS